MKVFEVTTEHCADDSDEVIKTVQYVAVEDDMLITVVDHFTRHCMEYEKDLIGVREVLVVTERIKKPEGSIEDYMKMYED